MGDTDRNRNPYTHATYTEHEMVQFLGDTDHEREPLHASNIR